MASALTVSRFATNVSGKLAEFPGVSSTSRPLNVVCVGAHPDDPETGCGGTLAKLAREGHHVSIIYLTRGEAGVKNGDRQATSRVRTAEAIEGSAVLGAQAYFADQVDGETSTEGAATQKFTSLLASLEPDIVFSHWPLDTHRDHRNAAQLTYEAWETLGESFT